MKNIISKSENFCKHCNSKLEWRSHAHIKQKHLNQPYYFSKWEYCRNCKTTWLHEEFKVFNKNDIARYIKNREEIEGQTSFFNSL